MQAVMETLFDIAYLSTVIALGILMLRRGGEKQWKLFGAMAVVLGGGDAFHLVPRALALCTTGLENWTAALGVGKLVTSVTMTVFYVLLYDIWRVRYGVKGKNGLTAAVLALAGARVVLCLFPQNGWTSAEPPLSWGIWRNVPFTALGVLLIVLWFRSAAQTKDEAFRRLWLAAAVSFGCYLPVVLFSQAAPAVGVLMIPKTCAYVWMVAIGYRAMKRNASVPGMIREG